MKPSQVFSSALNIFLLAVDVSRVKCVAHWVHKVTNEAVDSLLELIINLNFLREFISIDEYL